MKTTLKEIFEPRGLLHRSLERYEFRPTQLKMAEAVLEAIQNQTPLCVEAGTGTGKTLAYLIPALFSKKRVMISTSTKNLQEQLFKKDIPFIRQHFFPELKATYMKGRQNYLCLKKYDEGRSRYLPLQGGPNEFCTRLRPWLQQTETGDCSELDWLGEVEALWPDFDARSDTCVGQKCSHFRQCFVTRMRQRAFESDIVIVNHSLFFANLALETDEIGKILPDYSVLVLDEAHDVEDIAADYFGRQVSSYQIERLCRDLDQHSVDAKDRSLLIGRIRRRAEHFFSSFPDAQGRHSLNFFRQRNGSTIDLREELLSPFDRLRETLLALYHNLERQTQLPTELEPIRERVSASLQHLSEIFNGDDSNNVYWFERRRHGLFLHQTPIRVAPILRQNLFERTETTILTSATLATDQNFEYLKERLGIPDPAEVILEGEFNYTSQALLYVPRFLPEPRTTEYFLPALRLIRCLLDITQGHTFLLFTSNRQMERIYTALLQKCPYPLLRQGQMPRNRLLERFRNTPGAVLCATSSFWQGVDVQGDALRAVIIDKLPFAVPTEPIVAARMHHLKQEGENPFLKYTLPSAVITLKQGLGRLIRSRRDRGLLAILDSRLWTRRYGDFFWSSLPKCPVTDNMEQLRDFYSKDVS